MGFLEFGVEFVSRFLLGPDQIVLSEIGHQTQEISIRFLEFGVEFLLRSSDQTRPDCSVRNCTPNSRNLSWIS